MIKITDENNIKAGYTKFSIETKNAMLFRMSYNKGRELYTITLSPLTKFEEKLKSKRKWNIKIVEDIYEVLKPYNSSTVIYADIFKYYGILIQIEKDLNKVPNIEKLKEFGYWISDLKDYELYKKLGLKKYKAFKDFNNALSL